MNQVLQDITSFYLGWRDFVKATQGEIPSFYVCGKDFTEGTIAPEKFTSFKEIGERLCQLRSVLEADKIKYKDIYPLLSRKLDQSRAYLDQETHQYPSLVNKDILSLRGVSFDSIEERDVLKLSRDLKEMRIDWSA